MLRVKKDIYDGELLHSKLHQLEATRFRQCGELAEAEDLLSSVWETRKLALGERHPDTAHAQVDLGYVYAQTGRLELGERLIRTALSVQEDRLGKNHPTVARTISALASLATKCQDWAGAQALYERALQIRENSLGTTHHLVGSTFLYASWPYLARKEFALAKPLLERSIAILDKSPLAGQDDHRAALYYLGEACMAEGKPAEAEALFIKAWDAPGTKNLWRPLVLPTTILKALVGVSEQLGKTHKAGEYAQRLREIEAHNESKQSLPSRAAPEPAKE